MTDPFLAMNNVHYIIDDEVVEGRDDDDVDA